MRVLFCWLVAFFQTFLVRVHRCLPVAALACILATGCLSLDDAAEVSPPGSSAATQGSVQPNPAPTNVVKPEPSTKSADKPTQGKRRLPFSDPERVRAVNATLDLIEQGGPFPYRQDGTVFQNRENKLPKKPRGYYHEYTVKTPGSRDRGARRIVQGKSANEETYYTDDHYQTFLPIDPRRYP
ncbi:MAG: guanine-specific ribonuclease N1 and T1 [Polyangiaceae bacterium]|nr:guanine-specific ribonuclease N1 and T1 [Polyangiaceae bacterium]